MPRIATPSSPARVVPRVTADGSGPPSIRIGELPGHWHSDIET